MYDGVDMECKLCIEGLLLWGVLIASGWVDASQGLLFHGNYFVCVVEVAVGVCGRLFWPRTFDDRWA